MQVGSPGLPRCRGAALDAGTRRPVGIPAGTGAAGGTGAGGITHTRRVAREGRRGTALHRVLLQHWKEWMNISSTHRMALLSEPPCPGSPVRPAHRVGRASGPLGPRLCRVPGGAGGSACPAPAEQGSPSLHLPCLLNAPGTARSRPAQPLPSQEDFGVVFPTKLQSRKMLVLPG